MGDRLATIEMGQKLEGLCPFGEKELGPHLTQCGLGRVYLRTKWHFDPSSRLSTTDIGRKLGAVPLSWGGELGSHLIQCG